MLKRFEVSNFKGFKEELIFDLSARDYAYNPELVKDGVVNKALIYGKNGVGKSNLGIALFDITYHLTDTQRLPAKYLTYYRNLDNDTPLSVFKYYFQFEGKLVVYSYAKLSVDNLVYEKLESNGNLLLYYNYLDKTENNIRAAAGFLNFDLLIDNKLSVIKYIYKNTPTNTVPEITNLVRFCEGMLWYRSLSEGNMFAGLQMGGDKLTELLYESGKLEDFKQFLHANGVDYQLEFQSVNGEHELMVKFSNGIVPFLQIASTGTNALLLFYAWSLSYKKISLLFIDEFDAFLHFESAAELLISLNRGKGFQSIITSHNTYLMQNKYTRPDCCFIMTPGRVAALSNCTDKEIREAHNLEKMYINGAFSE